MARLLSALAFPVLLIAGGCGSDGAGPAGGEGGGIDATPVGGLLDGSWMSSAARDPAAVASLIDAPSGSGWLDLFHGDLAAAERSFSGAQSSSARLGMARVHLARAEARRVAARLHLDAALDLARYRRDHRAGVRTGPYELVLAARLAHLAGAPEEERAAFSAAAGTRAPGADPALHLGLERLVAGHPRPPGLPAALADRLAFADAVEAGNLLAARVLLPRVTSADPDVRDPLGEDVEAGVRFEGLYWDPVLLPALARLDLAEAYVLAANLPGPGAAIAAAVEGAWGGDLPVSLPDLAMPAADPLPAWTALFASHAVDRADWDAAWGRADGVTFASRLDAAMPEIDAGVPSDAAGVDAILRVVASLEPRFADALRGGASEEGAALVAELELARVPVDRALRTWMVALLDGGCAVQAGRLGDRAFDANAGSRGGAPDSARTRVSYRNDRAFLLELARCRWRGGQPGAALDLVFPLAEEDPAMAPAKHYLGQLDAAASIGRRGETSQL